MAQVRTHETVIMTYSGQFGKLRVTVLFYYQIFKQTKKNKARFKLGVVSTPQIVF